MPICTYSVHRDSPNGPLVKFTTVGEQLYHGIDFFYFLKLYLVWECPSKIYSMLLHGCSAIDGNGKEYNIIDENGKDEFLMPQVTYTSQNTKAMAASAAFNFPDRNTMSFSCKIRLCYNTYCSGITPPNCGENPNQVDAAESVLLKNLNSDKSNEKKISIGASSETTTLEYIPTRDIDSYEETTIDAQKVILTNKTWITSTEAIEKKTTLLADDFPRPALLPQQDFNEASGEIIPEKIIFSETSQEFTTTESNSHETNPPIKILKRAQSPSLKAAASANQKNLAKQNRQQREATTKNTELYQTNPHVIDFDISSPELTIMDNYQEQSAKQIRDTERATQENLLWETKNLAIVDSNGICFSFTVLILCVSFCTLMLISVVFIIFFKARKGMRANFY